MHEVASALATTSARPVRIYEDRHGWRWVEIPGEPLLLLDDGEPAAYDDDGRVARDPRTVLVEARVAGATIRFGPGAELVPALPWRGEGAA